MFPLVYQYLYYNERIVPPFFGVVRPIAAGLLIFQGFFGNSHPCFRWLFALGQVLLIVSDTCSHVYIDHDIQCRARGLCTNTNPSNQVLYNYMLRDILTVYLEVKISITYR